MSEHIRHLILVLGDQLNINSELFRKADKDKDLIWMAECDYEITYVKSHKAKILFFLSAMRHFRNSLQQKGYSIRYHELSDSKSRDKGHTFTDILQKDLEDIVPEKVLLTQPGDFRVLKAFQDFFSEKDIDFEIKNDDHFLTTVGDFHKYANGKKNLLLENYYRHLRKDRGYMMASEKKPEGGEWNFDKENRQSIDKKEVSKIPKPKNFKPDSITKELVELINSRFNDHPGSMDNFYLPVCREDAKDFLKDFIDNRAANFGKYQDALWKNEHLLYHSRLSALLNVKLLNPKEVLDAVMKAWHNEEIPVNSAEGFLRQILGWREFIRGVYWEKMPGYAEKNHLEAETDLPQFYWTGKTHMACIRDAMENVLENGYAHHIQRLMVLGLFSLIYGSDPYEFHEWHMAMYIDAVDWVSLPNTLGMSQYADGGIVGTKPYTASANYINKMSNYCSQCRYKHTKYHGENACPFNVFYYDFLDRHKEKLKKLNRMRFQINNLEKKGEELEKILEQAENYRENINEL